MKSHKLVSYSSHPRLHCLLEKAKATDRQAMTQHLTALESTHQLAVTELEVLNPV